MVTDGGWVWSNCALLLIVSSSELYDQQALLTLGSFSYKIELREDLAKYL